MSERALLEKLAPYIGGQIIGCIDAIESIAHFRGYSVNVMDPAFNGAAIDSEPKRVNVRTDKDSIITSFTIG